MISKLKERYKNYRENSFRMQLKKAREEARADENKNLTKQYTTQINTLKQIHRDAMIFAQERSNDEKESRDKRIYELEEQLKEAQVAYKIMAEIVDDLDIAEKRLNNSAIKSLNQLPNLIKPLVEHATKVDDIIKSFKNKKNVLETKLQISE